MRRAWRRLICRVIGHAWIGQGVEVVGISDVCGRCSHVARGWWR